MPIVPQPTPSAQAVQVTPRHWARRVAELGQIAETCPAWCTADHQRDRETHLEDLTHLADAVSVDLSRFHRGHDKPPDLGYVLGATMRVSPYSKDPAERVPHVEFEPAQDRFVGPLGPDEFETVIRELEAHTARLREVHRQLVALRAGEGAAA